MAGAFHAAGFEVWDVKMIDIVTSKISLDQFKGIAFVGGFRYEMKDYRTEGEQREAELKPRFSLVMQM